MIIVSCSGKFHAFNLAEQLNNQRSLSRLFTTYAYQKNILFRRLAKRVDKENIPQQLIKTNIPVAFQLKLMKDVFKANECYDEWVSKNLKTENFNVFIGWSGMSYHSIIEAKRLGKITIVERGSSHILYQNEILKTEYSKFGIAFSIDERVIEKELKEYEAADYISIPSEFVRNSFIEKGVKAEKLFVNNYGVSGYFNNNSHTAAPRTKFRILYVGGLTVQKGLIYFFEALKQLNIPEEAYEVWFLGSVEEPVQKIIPNYAGKNWQFFGHVNHYSLHNYINECDVAIQPSLQEGLSMVIPQIMGCGVPVIASTNSGGADIISDGVNGYIIPIRNAVAISEKIEFLYRNPTELKKLKENLADFSAGRNSWENYGSRYAKFLNGIV